MAKSDAASLAKGLAMGAAMAAMLVAPPLPLDGGQRTPDPFQFRKVQIDPRFVAEGVAIGDVNRDGKLDILAGNLWYQAPDWAPHEIAPFVSVDPKRAWSNCFNTWTDDLNRDGWIDQIVIGMPGEKAIWRENPKGAAGPWKEHLICSSAGNESPHYADLLGNGKRVLIMGTQDQYLAWFEPAADPEKEWICHPISEIKGAGSQRYSHGLGIGDLDRDGKPEVLTTQGFFRRPSDPRQSPWTFVPVDLGPDCAQMLVMDVNGDRRPDVLTTSAHARGVWCFEQTRDGKFNRSLIDETLSVTHAAHLAPAGEGFGPAFFTGKRKWAHPPGVDVGSDEPGWFVLYERKPTPQGGPWKRHLIDDDSGVGTQFTVRDMNRDGKSDLVSASKNGVYLLLRAGDGIEFSSDNGRTRK